MEDRAMDDTLQAGILTIGTEVSNGQIINGNSAWVANELTNLRLNPSWHMTVADLKDDMLSALSFLEKKTRIIVVTGGLGPTSDDFTRNIISEWADAPLLFDETSWQHILDRFVSLGVTAVPESNRQQCYFPKGARILVNRKGTAHGFRLEKGNTLCFVLPGPPEEIKAIWGDHIAAELSSLGAKTDALELMRWQCLGLSESKLGEMIEEIIKGSSLIAGYRPHLPYVELKIWCKKSDRSQEQNTLNKIDAAVSPWLMGKDDENLLDKFIPLLEGYNEVVIDDQASFGAIANRIGQRWSLDSKIKLTVIDHFSTEKKPQERSGHKRLELSIGPLNDAGSFDIWFRSPDLQKLQTLTLPFKRNAMRLDRERLYVCELALAALSRLANRGNLIA
jgi:nicotinamide-nucleotide amidase